MKKILIILLAFGCFSLSFAQEKPKTKNLIIITIDGLRWQDVFNGADSSFLNNKEITKKKEQAYSKYWAEQPEERRKKLMPFLWSTIYSNGQIYGNRKLGNNVNVANNYWFSYPGYSEIFCGFADDSINSNDLKPNPNKNVLEFINKNPEFTGKVAAFTSWDAFPYILNEKRSGVYVNAAFEDNPDKDKNSNIELLNKLQTRMPDIFSGVRLDAPTFYQGLEYLKAKHPRVFYLGFDETDDFAHYGRYDLYLDAAKYTDQFLSELWQWLQSDPQYKNKTTLFITVDHGRGADHPGWKSHGKKTEKSDETWFAVIGPDTSPMGEMTSDGQIYQNQYAKTFAAFVGIEYISQKPCGEIIKTAINIK